MVINGYNENMYMQLLVHEKLCYVMFDNVLRISNEISK